MNIFENFRKLWLSEFEKQITHKNQLVIKDPTGKITLKRIEALRFKLTTN